MLTRRLSFLYESDSCEEGSSSFKAGHFSSYFCPQVKSDPVDPFLLGTALWNVCSDIVDMVLSQIFFSLFFIVENLPKVLYGNFDFITMVSNGTYNYKVRSLLTLKGSSWSSSMFPSIVFSCTRLNSILLRD